MLKLSEDDDDGYVYTPKPGNPNILIGAKTKKQVQEEPPKKPKKRGRVKSNVSDIEQFLEPIFYQALQPLYRVVDMMGAESGKTLYYRYAPELSQEKRKIPIVYNCRTRKEFYAKNYHLGEEIISNIQVRFPVADDTTHKKEKIPKLNDDSIEETTCMIIGDPITQEQQKTYDRLVGKPTPLASKHAPQWIWCQLNDPVFQFLLQTNIFGALEMAANELNYPLKDLIYSRHVNFLFGQYVARKFVSPKQNAQASGVNGQKNVQYRIHSGFYTDQQDTKWLMGAKITFKTKVYYRDSETKLEDVEEKIQQIREEIRLNELAFTEALNTYNAIQGFPPIEFIQPNHFGAALAIIVQQFGPQIPQELQMVVTRFELSVALKKSLELALKTQRCFEPRVLHIIK